jgi:hypothetical protein
MKQLKKHFVLFFILWIIATLFSGKVLAQSFIHPGILHSNADLNRMHSAVALKQEPVWSGYHLFVKDEASQYTYKMQGPMDMVGRNPTVGQSAYDNDANAAHQNAIMWTITGDKRFADKAIEIINTWSLALKAITGRDAVLMAGLGPFKMINAAEIIRYTNAGWKAEDIARTEKHFKEVIYPVIKNYAPFANGNWDAAAMKTCLAIGVFCNDRRIFEDALRYYTQGWGNGRLQNYIVSEQGQIQESGRDQPHSQLGIGMLAECCAIAWNQGLDLYDYDNNLLLKGFEYVAKYNLGNDDMPFSEWLDRTGKYHHFKISDKGRGQLRPLYEQVFAHYMVLKGLNAAYVEQVVKRIRPEGAGGPGADHPGYGTLFFAGTSTSNKRDMPATPAGLVARGFNNEVKLSWIAIADAKVTYTIKRSDRQAGPFKIIATNIDVAGFTDKTVKRRQQYYYTVTAANKKGNSQNSFVQPVVAGLPDGWVQTDIGNINPGNTYYNGDQFSIESFGKGTGSEGDKFHYTCFPVKEKAALIFRIQPQPSSQLSAIGIMLREDSTAGSPFVSLTLYPGKSEQIEEPNWHTELEARAAVSEKIERLAEGKTLAAPAVTYGRLTGNYWLKLERNKEVVSASVSYDGVNWQEVSIAITPSISKNALMGITIASGINNSTNVRIDSIIVNGKSVRIK